MSEVISDTPISEEQLRLWLIQQVSNVTKVAPENIDPNQQIQTYGLDSSALLNLACELEDWLGKEIEQSTLYDYPTINALARFLSQYR